MRLLACCMVVATELAAGLALGQPPENSRFRPGRFGGPIVLAEDDVQVFADPPKSIVAERVEIPHGKLEMIEYESTTVGTTRTMNVYTPPGYSTEKKLPVLYLLHGVGGDETEWQRFATVDLLLDLSCGNQDGLM